MEKTQKLSYFGFLMLMSLAMAGFACGQTTEHETITFDEKNNVVLRGTITEKLADEFIYAFIRDSPKYVYINSNGGSIMAGNRIVSLIQQRNVSCIAEKAYSMAFVILQACSQRYITPMATVMQHQASLGIRGDIQPITNYLNMVHAMESQLNRMQACRIGMSESDFRTKITTEWWSFGEDIIHGNIADKVVNVQCSKELLSNTITSNKEGWFEDRVEKYSSCPLISTPIEVEHKDSFFKKVQSM